MVAAGRIKGVDDQSYVVYVDEPTREVNVHRLACRFVYMHGGVSHGSPPSSYYLGFFAELEAAEYAARRINPEFHRCSVCLP